MTEFVNHFTHTGNNFSCIVLKAMEKEMKKQGIATLCTIARLNSIPTNKTFLHHDYEYSGTLIKKSEYLL